MTKLAVLLITYVLLRDKDFVRSLSEDPPYDGWYNNLVHPDWGAADTQLIRLTPPAYSDGVYLPAREDGPNPFEVSERLFSGTQGLRSNTRTALIVFFGQQLVEEIVDAQRQSCPPEFLMIKVPKGHLYDNVSEGLEMPTRRSRFDQSTGYSPHVPRQQLNEITPFLDGNLVYGPVKAWADAIREFKGGRLKVDPKYKNLNESFPPKNDIRLPFANPPEPRNNSHRPVDRFHTCGNPRANENPFLLAFCILWFRYHNYLAEKIEKNVTQSGQHPPEEIDEIVFNEARKHVIAQYQKIVFYDWLPAWLGDNRPKDRDNYTGYNPNIHPGISQEFQTSAMRYGHTLIPTSVFRRRKNCSVVLTTQKTGFAGRLALRLCNAFWNSDEAVEENIDELLMGMSSSFGEKEDNIITNDVRLFVFGPREFTRRDLIALNIIRARDHGVADYNTTRVAFGLEPFYDISHLAAMFNFSLQLTANLTELYGNGTSIDPFVGGLLESDGFGPGPLFTAIMYEQFVRIRDGDRFWYENYKQNGMISQEVFEEIQTTTLKDIIVRVTNIGEDDIQDNPFLKEGDKCTNIDSIEISGLEECTPLKLFDYFSTSTISFALTFTGVGVFLCGCIIILICLINRRKRLDKMERSKTVKAVKDEPGKYRALEWLGPKTGDRQVLIHFDNSRFKIMVDSSGTTVRMLDLRRLKKLAAQDDTSNDTKIVTRRSNDGEMNLFVVSIPQESADLILYFPSNSHMLTFAGDLKTFLRDMNLSLKECANKEYQILKTSNNKEKRKVVMDNAVKLVCLQAFGGQQHNIDPKDLEEIIHLEMTKSEFAEILCLQPDSIFVRNMFQFVDKDNSGSVSFREFMDTFVIFASGDADEKLDLMFNMYDIKKQGYLRERDFKELIKSMLEMSNPHIDEKSVEETTQSMMKRVSMSGSNTITLEMFKKIFEQDRSVFAAAVINVDGIESNPAADAHGNNLKTHLRKTIIRPYGGGSSDAKEKRMERGKSVRFSTVPRAPNEVETHYTPILKFIENYRLQIFWVILYTLVAVGIFIERAVYYSLQREHGGLRHIAGYGVTVTRGAASGMMFTYATLLVTMSRNIITSLRETFVNRYLPLDSYISFHKYVALLALIFTVMHILGHSFNLYHICTQTAVDVNCLFREYFRASHIVASFHYWSFQTITGLTGVILTIIVIVMYVFAIQASRRYLFKVFWATHSLYPLLFIFMMLHGLGRLVQEPFTHYFILGPVVLFVVDRFMVFGRRSLEISVFKAKLLPSSVTSLEFKKPRNFDYRSGQWVRIACLEMNSSEYHPFTLSSAPHQDKLSLHIRAVGPWTKNLRKIYDPSHRQGKPFPKLYLDGPYGEGHQNWYTYDVSILVGGGIGVTPFASILKDIVYKSKIGAIIQCQKVYFMWVTRTQKHFEWMTDIIRQVEESDGQDIVSVHIFITQFKNKFDLRTTMLYICERNFQRVAQKSLFTGLKSITHFGRPDFYDFLLSLADEHRKVNQFGIFSCGPPPMTRNVERACSKLNSFEGPTYVHHYENF